MALVEITAMTFGPYGVCQLNGRAVLVPNATPGDRAEIELEAERRDYAIGRIARIVEASPDRRTPPCQYLPRCGGCDWQHIAYPAQLRIKASLIADEVGRALSMEIDSKGLVEPAPREYGYRSRIRLRVGPNGVLGFNELRSNRLVEIDHCLVADENIRLPHELAAALAARCDEIEVVHDGSQEVAVAYLRRAPTTREASAARALLAGDQGWNGAVLRGGQRREVIGDAQIAIELEPGLALRVDADLFSQVNHEQNRALVKHVIDVAAVDDGAAVLDLFCGAGNFSLPASRRGAKVTGVDSDVFAIAAARRNAERIGFTSAQFLAMQAAEVAQFLSRARYRPACVILDPPRTGAADLMESIAKLGAPRVIYVSCDPSTLARDLRLLSRHDYRLERIRGFDFFPNTHHAEIVATLLLT